jgi:hypothetical protein
VIAKSLEDAGLPLHSAALTHPPLVLSLVPVFIGGEYRVRG